MRFVLGTLGFVCLLATAASAAGSFDGLYRPDSAEGEKWDCQKVGWDMGALEIRGDVFEGVEYKCNLKNPQEIQGLDAVLYDAECSGEGETYSYPMMLMKLPEGLAMIEPGFVNQLKSCPQG